MIQCAKSKMKRGINMSETTQTSIENNGTSKKGLIVVSVIIGLICTLFVLFGMYKATFGAFLDIPVCSMLLGENEIEAYRADFIRDADKLEEMSTGATKSEIAKIETSANVKIEDIISLIRKPSINGLIKFGAIENLQFADEELVSILKIIRLSIYIYGAIIAFFTLLGALTKRKGFTITALILSVPFFLLFVGNVHTIVFAILCIAHCIFASKASKIS